MAGYLDGEGSFDYYTTPRIRISNTHLPTLKAIAAKYGGTLREKSGEYKGEARPCFEWSVTGDTAMKVLGQVHHHLFEKGDQARLVMEMRNLKPCCREVLQQQLKRMKRPEYQL